VHCLVLSVKAIHEVLVRHELSVLPAGRRGRHRPKRDSRPLPGDRVQMDTCRIRPGLHQHTAGDDCSRYLVLGLSRHASAADTLVSSSVRHDHGSHDLSDVFQREMRFLGIASSPAFVHAPEGNGCAECFMRTLKENLLWGHHLPDHRRPAPRVAYMRRN
jgi:hypothetical protein